jgi:hypothetical protein
MAGTASHESSPDRTGETVARAKRTARADARRRYRTEHGLASDATDVEAPETADAAPPTAQRARRPEPVPSARVGIGTAFRQAFRPVDLRADLAALPSLLRSKALWIPILLTAVSAVAFVIVRPQDRTDIGAIVAVFMFQYFLQTPAIGGVFIAGFLAPRASWLLGVIVGLVSAAFYSYLGIAGYIGVASTVRVQDVIIAAFIMSPIMGALFASAAAWYRRFLQLSNPNRGRRAVAERADGRTRKVNQKAPARR